MKKEQEIFSLLATRYAQALIKHLSDDSKTINDLSAMNEFFVRHRSLLVAMDYIFIDAARYDTLIQKILTAFLLPTQYYNFFKLLFSHKRMQLLPRIITHAKQMLYQRQRKIFVVIESAHELSVREKERIAVFLEQKTGYLVQSTFMINTQLIAGMRIKSDTFLLDCSIAYRLKMLSHLLAV